MARKVNVSITAYMVGGHTAGFYTEIDLEEGASESDIAQAKEMLEDLICNTVKAKTFLRVNTIGIHCDQVQGAYWSVYIEGEEE